MKMGLKFTAAITFCLLFSLACRKHEENPTVDCISEVINDSASMANQVSADQLGVIDSLFAQNRLSTAGLQFYSFNSNHYLPAGSNDSVEQIWVVAGLWFNGLPVFMYDENFAFYNAILQPGSNVYSGATPDTGIAFHQSLENLRLIYLDNFEKITISGGGISATVTHPPASIRDSCLTAQPGYIDASTFDPGIPAGTRLTKAWKVMPVGRSDAIVFIEDSTGAAWPLDIAYF